MKLTCYTYTLQLVTPLQTSNQSYRSRKGVILRYSNEEHHFYGEAAPLPGFSDESHNEIKQVLLAKKDEFEKLLKRSDPVEKLQYLYSADSIPASLQFGLDSLAYQIEAHKAGTSLPQYIFPQSPAKVPVNALISLQDENPIPKIKEYTAQGYQTIKCKVGLDINRELQLLQQIRADFSDLNIRVDANQEWSLDEAITYTNKLNDLHIEYCEEPLAENIPEQFEKLSINTELPIAIDETITQHSYWPNLLPYTQYLILKPMVIGSFKKNIETKRLASTHNNKVVVTTSLESSVARYFSGILAAGIGSSQLAHGLSTGRLFSEDVFQDDSFVLNGYFQILNGSLPIIDFNRHHIFSSLR